MASLVYQKEAAALLLAVLGQNASPSVFDTVGNQIEKGQTTAQAYISSLLSSSAGQALYASKQTLKYCRVSIHQSMAALRLQHNCRRFWPAAP